ncbi:hypothetical protein AMELA_G00150390 [Ameiurus melas]|uniref:Uncharacterized protein n=1 Tax=Ameiurus melas TaxID=219545 RepID=A0A7J6ALI6_AMEME|nr:hypothetical protein AMELA_G00150390 [Ameiurus melas]
MLHHQLLHISHLTSRDNICLVISKWSQTTGQKFRDSKMYHFVCFILLVSLEGLQGNGTTSYTSTNITTNVSITTPVNSSNTTSQSYSSKQTSTEMTSTSKQTSVQPRPSDDTDCLFNLKYEKDIFIWSMIGSLILICLLLLVIIMCLACKCCRRVKNGEMVVTKSSATIRRNSANGGPSETDILLKDRTSVKVEMETTPDEPQEPEELGGAAAEIENQVSKEENKNSANDTSENAPTQEGGQSDEIDPKTEDLEKAE